MFRRVWSRLRCVVRPARPLGARPLRLEFVSPQKGKTWRFKVEHNRVKFNMGLGSGLGLSGFTARVSGGEVMGEQYQGTGFAEQSALPEKIKQWQIWLVFGIGLLGEWKHVLFNLVTRVLSWDGV